MRAQPAPRHYFITIFTRDGSNYFGVIRNGYVEMLPSGKIADFVLSRHHELSREITLSEWVIMPNHIHLLIGIGRSKASPGKAIRKIKSAVRRWTKICGQDFQWQPSHHAYFINDEAELRRMQWYIRHNQKVWKSDSANRENRLILHPEIGRIMS